MFNNIGKKLKTIAWVVLIIGFVATVVSVIPMMVDDWIFEEMWPMVLLILLFGPVLSWLASIGVYAFGEVVEKLTKIEENTRK